MNIYMHIMYTHIIASKQIETDRQQKQKNNNNNNKNS